MSCIYRIQFSSVAKARQFQRDLQRTSTFRFSNVQLILSDTSRCYLDIFTVTSSQLRALEQECVAASLTGKQLSQSQANDWYCWLCQARLTSQGSKCTHGCINLSIP